MEQPSSSPTDLVSSGYKQPLTTSRYNGEEGWKEGEETDEGSSTLG